MRANLGFVLMVLACIAVEPVLAQTDYKAIEIPTLGGETATSSISDSGLVTGYSKNESNKEHPFIFDYDDETGEGTMIDLGLLPESNWGKAFGVNNLKYAVGFCRKESTNTDHAFLYKDGAMIDLSAVGSRAVGINNTGATIVQYSGGSARYDDGVVTELGPWKANAINSTGQIVGIGYYDDQHNLAGNGSISRAVLYENGNVIDLGVLPSEEYVFVGSEAFGLNDKGQVVGVSWTLPNGVNPAIKHAFLWEESTGMTDLGTLGGNESWATSINENGDIVGTSFTVGSDLDSQVGFLWQDGIGMQDLSTLAGINVGSAEGIADNGYIADAGSGAFLLVPIGVPEPSTLALLVTASISFAAYLWRQKK